MKIVEYGILGSSNIYMASGKTRQVIIQESPETGTTEAKNGCSAAGAVE